MEVIFRLASTLKYSCSYLFHLGSVWFGGFRKDRKENRKNGFCGRLVGEMRWRKTNKTLNVLSKSPQKINSFNLVRFIITITIGQGILSLECFTFYFILFYLNFNLYWNWKRLPSALPYKQTQRQQADCDY